jgi:hypothetical protein
MSEGMDREQLYRSTAVLLAADWPPLYELWPPLCHLGRRNFACHSSADSADDVSLCLPLLSPRFLVDLSRRLDALLLVSLSMNRRSRLLAPPVAATYFKLRVMN